MADVSFQTILDSATEDIAVLDGVTLSSTVTFQGSSQQLSVYTVTSTMTVSQSLSRESQVFLICSGQALSGFFTRSEFIFDMESYFDGVRPTSSEFIEPNVIRFSQ